jgi:putative flippase GtrA
MDRILRLVPRQFVRFACVGVINTVIDFVIFCALVYGFFVNPVAANVVGYIGGLLNGFVMSKFWVFKDCVSKSGTSQLSVFFVVYLSGLLVSTGIVWSLASYSAVFAKIVATAITTAWNYTGCRRIVFSN